MTVNELWAEKPPFASHRSVNIRAMVLEGNRPAPATEIHPRVWRLVERCWRENPKARPTFAQVVLRLKRFPDHWSASMRASMGIQHRHPSGGGDEDTFAATALPEDEDESDNISMYDARTLTISHESSAQGRHRAISPSDPKSPTARRRRTEDKDEFSQGEYILVAPRDAVSPVDRDFFGSDNRSRDVLSNESSDDDSGFGFDVSVKVNNDLLLLPRV